MITFNCGIFVQFLFLFALDKDRCSLCSVCGGNHCVNLNTLSCDNHVSHKKPDNVHRNSFALILVVLPRDPSKTRRYFYLGVGTTPNFAWFLNNTCTSQQKLHFTSLSITDHCARESQLHHSDLVLNFFPPR